ncbi:hypothetical protein RHGRI_025922 [Rhododendron griersonianum]|uniref:Uncharacterized protein n=1 Tax=Rhododendron griersonianum TaxID=479676 RepID=A0AAV6IT82_9ERIC|nr:hypothetical protein RHGRI_025922 [Rhododendron griersonianum]
MTTASSERVEADGVAGVAADGAKGTFEQNEGSGFTLVASSRYMITHPERKGHNKADNAKPCHPLASRSSRIHDCSLKAAREAVRRLV